MPAKAKTIPTAQVFLRTSRAEWTRLWTVKATWWFLLVATLLMVGIAVIAGFDASSNPMQSQGDPAWRIIEITPIPAQFALLAIALMAVTADYATGGIVPALQWTPNRSVFFAARTLIAAGTATALGLVLAVVSSVAAYLVASDVLTLPLDVGIDNLSKAAIVFGGGTVLAVGLGFILRNTAGTLVSVFVLLLVLPLFLPQFGYQILTSLADLLPGSAVMYLLTGELTDRGFSYLSASSTLLIWAVGSLALGWLRLSRDDANK